MPSNSLSFVIDSTGDAQEKLVQLSQGVKDLGDRIVELGTKEADPKVSLEDTEARAKIDELRALLDELSHKDATPKVTVDTTNALTNMKVVLATLGSFVGAGALASGALLALPAAFAAIGAAAEHSNDAVANSFASMATAAKQSLEQGFTPLVPTFVNLANQAKTTLVGLEPQFKAAAGYSAPLLQAVGSGFLQAVNEGMGQFPGILRGMQPVADALGQAFVNLERGAIGFFQAINPGPAAQGLNQLSSIIGQLLPEIGQLVNDIVPLGNDFLSILGPALNAVAQDMHYLAPPIQLVGSILGALGPLIGAVTPAVLVLAGGTKLLTGSWTDFAGAAEKLASPIKNSDTLLTSLANKVGITTAAQNAETKALAENAAQQALANKQIAERAAVQAAWTAEEEGTVEAEVAAIAATEELAVADDALAAAEAEAATAAKGLTVSLGPIGLLLGAVGGIVALFALQSGGAANKVGDLSQQLIQLGTDGPQAAASLAASNKDLAQLSTDLTTVGTSATGFAQAYSGSVQQAQDYTDGLVKKFKDLASASTDTGSSVGDLAVFVKTGQIQLSSLSQTTQEQVRQYMALNDILPSAQGALQGVKDGTKAANEALQQEGIVLSEVSQGWNALGNTIDRRVKDFQSATAGIKSITDNTLAMQQQVFQTSDSFAQLDQAVNSAQQSYQSASEGIASAQHSLEQSAQGVANARHGEEQAALAVAQAEHSVQQAYQSEVQANSQLVQAQQALANAQRNVATATQAATQALQDEQRQVIDQGDTIYDAQIRLLDAQKAVNAAGLGGQSLASIGPLTAANEQQFQLLLSLQEAQHNLNDATARGQQLATQNAAAQAAGVAGSQQVIAANQQVAQAQQSVVQASDGLANAQYGVQQANQGVTNALYSEQQAHIATQNAIYGEQQSSIALQQAILSQRTAAQALTDAKANDSRTTDLNTEAGARNFAAIEQLFEKNLTATGSIQQATTATEQQAGAMGFTTTAVDQVITALTSIPATTQFAIVGTPSLNLSALLQQAQAEGISPFSLGLPSADVQLAWDNLHGKASGGLITGPGTGTSDSILARGDNGSLLRVSNGEYIVRAERAQQFPHLLDAINGSGPVPGYATGGTVTNGKALLGVNLRLAGWDAVEQGVAYFLGSLGNPTGNLPPPGTIDFGAFAASAGFGSSGGTAAPSVSGIRGSAAANRAIVMQIFASMFGWGSAAEQAATDYLEMRESGYNNIAQNPNSTAYGMFQFLNSTWSGYGIPKTSDPTQQAIAGGRYIAARYGDPIGAAAHERAFNWFRDGGPVRLKALQPPQIFDQGGKWRPGTAGINLSGRTEAVLNPDETDAYKRVARSAATGRLGNTTTINVQAITHASADDIGRVAARHLEFALRG